MWYKVDNKINKNNLNFVTLQKNECENWNNS